MRVWLIEQEVGKGARVSLEPVLRGLAQQSPPALVLVGASAFAPELPKLLRNGLLNGLIFHVDATASPPAYAELLGLDLPILLLGEQACLEAWRSWADEHTVAFLPAAAGAPELALTLRTLGAAHRRESGLRAELHRFRQRLGDRIIIEKAKGILIQRLGLTEDQAYKQLRVQSRRQRKQIREIAQSILDTQFLLAAEGFIQPCDSLDEEPPAANEFKAS
jgi:hypothetical protein